MTSLFQCVSRAVKVAAPTLSTIVRCMVVFWYAQFQQKRSASHVTGASASAASRVRHCSRRAASSGWGMLAHMAAWSSRHKSPSLRNAACRCRGRPCSPTCRNTSGQSTERVSVIRSYAASRVARS